MMVDFSFNADRADVIEQATRIYLMGMKHSNSTQIHVPKVGLADGMVNCFYKRRGSPSVPFPFYLNLFDTLTHAWSLFC